jgi:hypothetical protein
MKSHNSLSRKNFLGKILVGSAALHSLSNLSIASDLILAKTNVTNNIKRIGVIGLDTSHSEIFSRMINEGELKDSGFKVVAAYPHGSKDIASALGMKQGIIEAIKKMGIEIVDSIDSLLEKVDYVLLESNDGKTHLEQASKVFKAKKPMFIDKPLAATLEDVEKIIELSKKYNTPFFSSSALRYEAHVMNVKNGSIGKVTGADTYTPAEIDPGHIDMAWYGIHGVEMLFAVMGTGCKSVRRIHTEGTDMLVGVWDDNRIGTVRGIRKGSSNIAGIAFGENGITPLGPFTTYLPLVKEILNFFDTRHIPFDNIETLEIFKFMYAADLSKKNNGKEIQIL